MHVARFIPVAGFGMPYQYMINCLIKFVGIDSLCIMHSTYAPILNGFFVS